MYKFICANITKSRNFTNSYKKLAQSKKYHLDGSSPKTASDKDCIEEKWEENPDQTEEEIGIKPDPVRPSTSPVSEGRFPFAPIIRSIKSTTSSPSLKVKSQAKFPTGSFLAVQSPTTSISKKYYHVYNIAPIPTTFKRFSSSSSFKHFENYDETNENYKKAMEDLYKIHSKKTAFQWKVANSDKPPFIPTEIWAKRDKRKSRSEITYPTHTIKHNIINQRFRIKEGSASTRIMKLEGNFKKKKHFIPKTLKKRIYAENISYPTTSKNSKKKGKINVVTMFSPSPIPEEKEDTNVPLIKIVKNVRNQGDRYHARSTQPNRRKQIDTIDEDFESLIRSHPTIQNASKEVKMKLKTKFIQLLLKSSQEVDAVTVSENKTAEEAIATEDSENFQFVEEDWKKLADNREHRKEGGDVKETVEQVTTNGGQIKSHPSVFAEKSRHTDYMAIRYPKRVLLDSENTFDINDVCIKECNNKSASAFVSPTIGIEEPKFDYRNLEKEAEEFSTFVSLQCLKKTCSDSVKINKKKTKMSSYNTETKIEQLRKDRQRLSDELDKLSKIRSEEEAKIKNAKLKEESKRKKSEIRVENELALDDVRVNNEQTKAQRLTECMKKQINRDDSATVKTKNKEIMEEITKTNNNLSGLKKDREERRIGMVHKTKQIQEASTKVGELNKTARNAELVHTSQQVGAKPKVYTRKPEEISESDEMGRIGRGGERKQDLPRRKEVSKEESLEENSKSDVGRHGKRKVNFSPSLKMIKRLPRVYTTLDVERESKRAKALSASKAPTSPSEVETTYLSLEEPDETVQDLNDIAQRTKEAAIKKKLRREERRLYEEKVQKQNSSSSLRSSRSEPRLDKMVDLLKEKIQIGEKAKKKIEQISLEVPRKTARPAARRGKRNPPGKLDPKYQVNTIDEVSKCDELNQMAHDLSSQNLRKKKKPEENKHSPELLNQDTDVGTNENTSGNKQPDEPEGHQKDEDLGDPNKLPEQTLSPSKGQAWKKNKKLGNVKEGREKLKSEKLKAQNVETHKKIGGITDPFSVYLVSHQLENSSECATNAPPPCLIKEPKITVIKPVTPWKDTDVSLTVETSKSRYLNKDSNITLEEVRQARNLKQAVDSVKSLKVDLPPVQQPTETFINNRYGDDVFKDNSVVKKFKEQVLSKYFDEKILPGTRQQIYFPKQSLVISDVPATQDNTAVKQDKVDVFENGPNKPTVTIEVKTNADLLKSTVSKNLDDFFSKNCKKDLSLKIKNKHLKAQIKDEAAKLDADLCMSVDKALEEVNKLDDMLDKIKDLEKSLVKKNEVKIGETKFENKPRVPPMQKPPIDKKEKKEKPKGPKDMVLPPKVRGVNPTVPESVPKEHHTEEENVKPTKKAGRAQKSMLTDNHFAKKAKFEVHQGVAGQNSQEVMLQPYNRKKPPPDTPDLEQAISDFVKEEKLDEVYDKRDNVKPEGPKNVSKEKDTKRDENKNAKFSKDRNSASKVPVSVSKFKKEATRNLLSQENCTMKENDSILAHREKNLSPVNSNSQKGNNLVVKAGLSRTVSCPPLTTHLRKSKSIEASAVLVEDKTGGRAASCPPKSSNDCIPGPKAKNTSNWLMQSKQQRAQSVPTRTQSLKAVAKFTKPNTDVVRKIPGMESIAVVENIPLRPVSCPSALIPRNTTNTVDDKTNKNKSEYKNSIGPLKFSSTGRNALVRAVRTRPISCPPMAQVRKAGKPDKNVRVTDDKTDSRTASCPPKSSTTGLPEPKTKYFNLSSQPVSQQAIRTSVNVESGQNLQESKTKYSSWSSNSTPPENPGYPSAEVNWTKKLVSADAGKIGPSMKKDSTSKESTRSLSLPAPSKKTNVDTAGSGSPKRKKIIMSTPKKEKLAKKESPKELPKTICYADKNLKQDKPLGIVNIIIPKPAAEPFNMFASNRPVDKPKTPLQLRVTGYSSETVIAYGSQGTFSLEAEQDNRVRKIISKADQPKPKTKYFNLSALAVSLAKRSSVKVDSAKSLQAPKTKYSSWSSNSPPENPCSSSAEVNLTKKLTSTEESKPGHSMKKDFTSKESTRSLSLPARSKNTNFDTAGPPVVDGGLKRKKIVMSTLPKQQKSVKKEPPKELPTTVCCADKNLKQDKPLGVVNIIIPKPVAEGHNTNMYASKRSLDKIPPKLRVTGYSSETVIAYGSDGTLALKVDHDNIARKVMSKAGISTSPELRLDDNFFKNQPKSDKRLKKTVPKQEEDKDKKAIFRITYDGEVFIIKKADETFGESMKKESVNANFSKTKQLDYMDVNRKYLETRKSFHDPFVQNVPNIVSNIRKKEKVEPIGQDVVDADPEKSMEKKPESIRVYRKQDDKKLVAKITEIILRSEEPVKSPSVAKIVTIYDKKTSTKLKKNLTIEKFNRGLKKDVSSEQIQKFDSIFGGLGSDAFQGIKDDFFRNGLKNAKNNLDSKETVFKKSQSETVLGGQSVEKITNKIFRKTTDVAKTANDANIGNREKDLQKKLQSKDEIVMTSFSNSSNAKNTNNKAPKVLIKQVKSMENLKTPPNKTEVKSMENLITPPNKTANNLDLNWDFKKAGSQIMDKPNALFSDNKSLGVSKASGMTPTVFSNEHKRGVPNTGKIEITKVEGNVYINIKAKLPGNKYAGGKTITKHNKVEKDENIEKSKTKSETSFKNKQKDTTSSGRSLETTKLFNIYVNKESSPIKKQENAEEKGDFIQPEKPMLKNKKKGVESLNKLHKHTKLFNIYINKTSNENLSVPKKENTELLSNNVNTITGNSLEITKQDRIDESKNSVKFENPSVYIKEKKELLQNNVLGEYVQVNNIYVKKSVNNILESGDQIVKPPFSTMLETTKLPDKKIDLKKRSEGNKTMFQNATKKSKMNDDPDMDQFPQKKVVLSLNANTVNVKNIYKTEKLKVKIKDDLENTDITKFPPHTSFVEFTEEEDLPKKRKSSGDVAKSKKKDANQSSKNPDSTKPEKKFRDKELTNIHKPVVFKKERLESSLSKELADFTQVGNMFIKNSVSNPEQVSQKSDMYSINVPKLIDNVANKKSNESEHILSKTPDSANNNTSFKSGSSSSMYVLNVPSVLDKSNKPQVGPKNEVKPTKRDNLVDNEFFGITSPSNVNKNVNVNTKRSLDLKDVQKKELKIYSYKKSFGQNKTSDVKKTDLNITNSTDVRKNEVKSAKSDKLPTKPFIVDKIISDVKKNVKSEIEIDLNLKNVQKNEIPPTNSNNLTTKLSDINKKSTNFTKTDQNKSSDIKDKQESGNKPFRYKSVEGNSRFQVDKVFGERQNLYKTLKNKSTKDISENSGNVQQEIINDRKLDIESKTNTTEHITAPVDESKPRGKILLRSRSLQEKLREKNDRVSSDLKSTAEVEKNLKTLKFEDLKVEIKKNDAGSSLMPKSALINAMKMEKGPVQEKHNLPKVTPIKLETTVPSGTSKQLNGQDNSLAKDIPDSKLKTKATNLKKTNVLKRTAPKDDEDGWLKKKLLMVKNNDEPKNSSNSKECIPKIVSNLKDINETIKKIIQSKIEEVVNPNDITKKTIKGEELKSTNNRLEPLNTNDAKPVAKTDSENVNEAKYGTKFMETNNTSDEKNDQKETLDNLKKPIRGEMIKENIKNAADKLVKCGIMDEKCLHAEKVIADNQANSKAKVVELEESNVKEHLPDSQDVKDRPEAKKHGKNNAEPSLGFSSRLEQKDQQTTREELEQRMLSCKKTRQVLKRRGKQKMDEIEDMNSAAQHILKRKEEQEWDEMFRGGKRQRLYEKETKMSRPTSGTAPWGAKVKEGELLEPPTKKDDTKNVHNSTNVPPPSNQDSPKESGTKLISKAEFYRLQRKVNYSKKSDPDNDKITINNKPFKKQESKKYVNESPDKQQLSICLQGKNIIDNVQDLKEKSPLENVKQIASETDFHITKKTNLNAEILTFKINKMAKLIVDDLTNNKSREKFIKGNLDDINKVENIFSVKSKPEAKGISNKEMKDSKNPSASGSSQNMEAQKNAEKSSKAMRYKTVMKKTNDNSKDKIKGVGDAFLSQKERTNFEPAKKEKSNETNIKSQYHQDELVNNRKSGDISKCPYFQGGIQQHDSPTKKEEDNTPNKSDVQKIDVDLKTKDYGSKKIAHVRKTPQTVQDLTKRSLGIKKSSKRKGYTYKLKKHFCKRYILPMKKPDEILKEFMVNYPSTLHKPVGDEVKVVPKEILEIEETAKTVKKNFVVQQFDPLAKYRHLKITYIAIKKPKKSKEKYLPTAVNKFEGKQMSEQDKNDIINFRYEILRRLNKEFNQIQNHPTKPPEKSPPVSLIVHDFDNPPAKSDKPVAKIVGQVKKDLKKENSQKEENMNSAKVLFQIKPGTKVNFNNVKGNLKRIIVDENENNLPIKGLEKNDGVKKNDGRPKTGDGSGGVGNSTRKFSTSADDKYVKPDDPDPYRCVSGSQKTYPNEGDCEAPPVIQGCPETPPDKGQENLVCKEEEDEAFNITKEVPKAFELASEQLEEHRRKNLYYRYHQQTWYDLHEYLHKKRVFSIDKAVAEKEKTNQTKN